MRNWRPHYLKDWTIVMVGGIDACPACTVCAEFEYRVKTADRS